MSIHWWHTFIEKQMGNKERVCTAQRLTPLRAENDIEAFSVESWF